MGKSIGLSLRKSKVKVFIKANNLGICLDISGDITGKFFYTNLVWVFVFTERDRAQLFF